MHLIKDFNHKTAQVHVDIKPSNICMSHCGKELYLIDFGYSTAPTIKLPGQTGTPLFMAYALQTIGATCIFVSKLVPTIEDDFESLAYVIMFLLVGGKKGLPWGGLRTHKDIAAMKSDNVLASFCQKLVDTEYEPIRHPLQNMLKITRDRSVPWSAAHFTQLTRPFEDMLTVCGWVNDRCYDWVVSSPEISEQDSNVTAIRIQ